MLETDDVVDKKQKSYQKLNQEETGCGMTETIFLLAGGLLELKPVARSMQRCLGLAIPLQGNKVVKGE